MGYRLWPLLNLVVRTPRLELRVPNDDLLFELAELSTGDIHPPETMPFGMPWSDVSPDERGRSTLQFNWRSRAEWKPESWNCSLVTVVGGRVVGTQGVIAANFAATRTVTTGSWLGMEYQGQGIGKEMRAAVVHLAFAGLGAQRCESAAFHDNGASLGVSRALGYDDNGDEIHMRRDKADRIVRLLLTRDAWEPRRRADITIEGLEDCLELFGAA